MIKGERMAKRSTFSSIMRRRLSDITNSPLQHKVVNLNNDDKSLQAPPSTEDVINQLIKEKMMLMKLIEEKNKIIELSGNELQNLRINLQKLQIQNRTLAQTNSQYLAELNFGRDKLKGLQHELVCKDALLKIKNSETQGNKSINCENASSQMSKEVIEKVAAEGLPARAKDKDQPSNCNRRRTARSKSMGPSSSQQEAAEKDKIENKRRCLRRQSVGFQSQEREPAENLFEIEDTKLPDTLPPGDPMHEDVSSPASSSIKNNKETCTSKDRTLRPSIGRPSRRAAVKVQSYKEVPLNVKMRRSE